MVARDQFGDVADPTESFPQMTRTMNAQRKQQIVGGEGFNGRAVEFEVDEIAPEGFALDR